VWVIAKGTLPGGLLTDNVRVCINYFLKIILRTPTDSQMSCDGFLKHARVAPTLDLLFAYSLRAYGGGGGGRPRANVVPTYI
jgi:hypothetical protein